MLVYRQLSPVFGVGTENTDEKNARRNEPEGVWQLRIRPEEPAGCVIYLTA
jgi:hypothetical protein